MLWLLGAVGIYTVLSFAAAIIASKIMAIVHGTPVQSALEERCKLSWYRPESFLGYHPLNHRTWHAMVTYRAMPAEALGKQRALRIIFTLQTLTLISAMVGMLALSVRPLSNAIGH